MSNVFTLDALREDTVKKYAPVKIGLSGGKTVELKSILRLGEKTRKEVIETMNDLQSLGEDSDSDEVTPEEADLITEAISKIFGLLTKSPVQLLKELDHEDPVIKVAMLTGVLNRWIGESQLGEAESSPT